MKQSQSAKKAINLGAVGLNLVIYLLVVYFIYHSLNGERGIFAYQRITKELKTKQEILYELKVEREKLENKVKLMNIQKIDDDMLDELSRKKLGKVGKDDIILIIKK